MRLFAFRALAATVTLLPFGASGCRDAESIVQAGPPPAVSITPRIVKTISGSRALVAVGLDVRGGVGRIGSFAGRLSFDPDAVTFEGVEELGDGTLRASNPGAREVRVAGASATGIDIEHLVVLRFAVKSARELPAMRFEIEELHELSRASLQARVAAPMVRP